MLESAERETLRRDVRQAVATENAEGALLACRMLMRRSDNPADAFFCSSQLKKMTEVLRSQSEIRSLKTYVVRSVTVEPMLSNITVEALQAGYLLDMEIGGFGSYAEEMMDPGGALACSAPELLLVVFDLEDVAGRLPELCGDGVGAAVEDEVAGCVERMARLLRGVRVFSKARIVMQGFVVPDRSSLGDIGEGNLPHGLTYAVRQINERLAAVCGELSDCVFFDVDHLAARYGRSQWRDTRLFLTSRLPVAAENFAIYARGLVRSINVLFRAPRKVLCTDLDNTMWGGVLGEEGANGIVTGSTYPGTPFFAYQRFLKQLSLRGVLLAVVSKNDDAEVREAFGLRKADLGLTLDDFAATKINWNDKVQSLRELARELSLGLESFVFVDDNPVECEAVRRSLPEVAVVETPLDEPWRAVELLAEESFFDVMRVTGDDRQRLKDYKAQVQRVELEGKTCCRDEFLSSLEMVCTFESAIGAPLSRAVQLLAKTNQFNLTTRRRSATEVEEFGSIAGGQAVVVRVRDRFGDGGVVGLALASQLRETCRLDSFLLSCRVIGRGIEGALLAHVAECAMRSGATELVGEFIPTRKNGVCANFYADYGFQKLPESEDGAIFYALDLRSARLKTPSWIRQEGEVIHELSEAALV